MARNSRVSSPRGQGGTLLDALRSDLHHAADGICDRLQCQQTTHGQVAVNAVDGVAHRQRADRLQTRPERYRPGKQIQSRQFADDKSWRARTRRLNCQSLPTTTHRRVCIDRRDPNGSSLRPLALLRRAVIGSNPNRRLRWLLWSRVPVIATTNSKKARHTTPVRRAFKAG